MIAFYSVSLNGLFKVRVKKSSASSQSCIPLARCAILYTINLIIPYASHTIRRQITKTGARNHAPASRRIFEKSSRVARRNDRRNNSFYRVARRSAGGKSRPARYGITTPTIADPIGRTHGYGEGR